MERHSLDFEFLFEREKSGALCRKIICLHSIQFNCVCFLRGDKYFMEKIREGFSLR